MKICEINYNCVIPQNMSFSIAIKDKEHDKRVQEYLFSFGFKWRNGSTTYLDYFDTHPTFYLDVTSNKKIISYSSRAHYNLINL